MSTEVIRIDLNGVNAYLLKSENSFVLVDTGGYLLRDGELTNRREILTKSLEDAGCTGQKLKLILLTHGDNDHSGNAAFLKERYQSKIAIHNDDRELVEQPTVETWMKSFRYGSWVMKLAFQLLKKTITKVTEKTLAVFESFSPDLLLEDGFDLSAYGVAATVICIPGHTKGSVAVLTPNGDLIAGDTFTNMKKPKIAPNADDFKQLVTSVEKLKKYPIKTVCPGHGEPFPYEKTKK